MITTLPGGAVADLHCCGDARAFGQQQDGLRAQPHPTPSTRQGMRLVNDTQPGQLPTIECVPEDTRQAFMDSYPWAVPVIGGERMKGKVGRRAGCLRGHGRTATHSLRSHTPNPCCYVNA